MQLLDPIGRVKTPTDQVVGEWAGVHRRGSLFGGTPARVVAEARWFETVVEWHQREATAAERRAAPAHSAPAGTA